MRASILPRRPLADLFLALFAMAVSLSLDPTAPYLVGLALLASAVALNIVAAPRSLAGAAP